MIEVTLDAPWVDADMVVACKPAGLLSVPGRGADKQDCLLSRLSTAFGKLHVVHRLDQATSGLLVFARNLAALRALHAQFRLGTVEKVYEAIAHGKVLPAHQWIDLPLAADWPNRPKQKVDPLHGKPSRTEVLVQGLDAIDFDVIGPMTRLRLIPKTGRTHQLRVHLQAIGHPLVGDALYGLPDGAWRLMLHACELALTHPSEPRRLTFVSPLRLDVARGDL